MFVSKDSQCRDPTVVTFSGDPGETSSIRVRRDVFCRCTTRRFLFVPGKTCSVRVRRDVSTFVAAGVCVSGEAFSVCVRRDGSTLRCRRRVCVRRNVSSPCVSDAEYDDFLRRCAAVFALSSSGSVLRFTATKGQRGQFYVQL